jgi:transaldolase
MPINNPTPNGKRLSHPGSKAPKIFADTGAIEEIRPLWEAGIINGVTTNPTLLKRAGATSWEGAKGMMKDIVRLLDPYPVSLELTELEPGKMIAQAEELAAYGPNVVIKVPIGGYQAIDPALDQHTGLKVLHALWKRDIRTNATLIFNSTQALFAAQAGASYVSPFLGRLADYMYKHDQVEMPVGNSLHHVEDHKGSKENSRFHNTAYVASSGARKDAGIRLIHEIAVIFSNYEITTEVLAASFRNGGQIPDCLLCGADILTIPAPILMGVADHPLTDEGIKAFVEDSKAFEA